ncbi:MAG TPA: DUF2652 domain-containing protein [Candidatus Limnocylindrales bacterium]|nr:DUF2652 domain-containing protein [Candidatus Limnocylindrales bacterium]
MASTPERGYLLIADLTGYTAYLSRGEIEHAPAIAGDLIETVVGRLEPPFRLAKLEGDAAFLYVEDGRADGSLLLDAIEVAYLAFRRRLRSIEQASACDCTACSTAPRLDLKFFVHHGEYVRHSIAGRDELAGASIIVVHRLLKGAAAAAAHDASGGAMGFAVFTAEALAAIGADPVALGATTEVEAIEHLGEVTTHTIDLEGRWLAESGARRLEIDGDRALFEVEVDVPADPATVWAHLTSPALRPLWDGPIAITETASDGRRGVGTRAQCVTGRLATLEEIVDWQPYEHVGYRLAVPDVGPVEATYDLEAIGAATSVRLRWAAAGSSPDNVAVERLRGERTEGLRRLAAVLAIPVAPRIGAGQEPAWQPAQEVQA